MDGSQLPKGEPLKNTNSGKNNGEGQHNAHTHTHTHNRTTAGHTHMLSHTHTKKKKKKKVFSKEQNELRSINWKFASGLTQPGLHTKYGTLTDPKEDLLPQPGSF